MTLSDNNHGRPPSLHSSSSAQPWMMASIDGGYFVARASDLSGGSALGSEYTPPPRQRSGEKKRAPTLHERLAIKQTLHKLHGFFNAPTWPTTNVSYGFSNKKPRPDTPQSTHAIQTDSRQPATTTTAVAVSV